MKFACPCCGHLTLGYEPPGSYEICEVCRWEDDPVQFRDHSFEGGANIVSLAQAKENYAAVRVSDPRFAGDVRAPLPEEIPLRN